MFITCGWLSAELYAVAYVSFALSHHFIVIICFKWNQYFDEMFSTACTGSCEKYRKLWKWQLVLTTGNDKNFVKNDDICISVLCVTFYIHWYIHHEKAFLFNQNEPIFFCVFFFDSLDEKNKLLFNVHYWVFQYYIVGLVHDCIISTANTLEILQSCTKPSIFDGVIREN